MLALLTHILHKGARLLEEGVLSRCPGLLVWLFLWRSGREKEKERLQFLLIRFMQLLLWSIYHGPTEGDIWGSSHFLKFMLPRKLRGKYSWRWGDRRKNCLTGDNFLFDEDKICHPWVTLPGSGILGEEGQEEWAIICEKTSYILLTFWRRKRKTPQVGKAQTLTRKVYRGNRAAVVAKFRKGWKRREGRNCWSRWKKPGRENKPLTLYSFYMCLNRN